MKLFIRGILRNLPVFKFIKHHFNRDYVRGVNLIYVLLLIIGFFILTKLHPINEIKNVNASIITFFGLVRFHELYKIPRNKKSSISIKNKALWNVLNGITIWLKRCYTPNRIKVIRIIHEFDFFKENKTKLRYKLRKNKPKSEGILSMYNLNIDLKNINQGAISGLVIGLSKMEDKAVFDEEKDVYRALKDCIIKSESVVFRE